MGNALDWTPEILRERMRAKLIAELDPSFFIDVGKTVDTFLNVVFVTSGKTKTLGAVLPSSVASTKNIGGVDWGTVDGNEEIAKVVLRGGKPLSAEEKKSFGIRANAKYHSEVANHFTPSGLKQCGKHAKIITHFIIKVLFSLDQLPSFRAAGFKEVKFDVFQNAGEPLCEACKKLEGSYPIKDVPIPGLDTHIECRCLLKPNMSSL